MLRNFLTKGILTILLGVVFFLSGVGVASAQVVVTQPAGTTSVAQVAPNNQLDTLYGKLKCVSWTSVDINGCLAIGIYGLVYKPAAYLLEGSGYIFDKILSLSIEGALVVPPFIDSSWMVVRDFSNMLFIFILIYTGIQTILGLGKWTDTIKMVIIMALLINFSLFFTKVVIDAGNILAVGVKGSIITTNQSISESLAGAFKPESFLSASVGTPGPWESIVVFIVATIVSGFAAYIFFKVAILFSRRLIIFWALMILAPIAFVSIALPGKGNKFPGWLDELIGQAFVAPIFLFFIYLIMQVINAPAPAGGKMLDLISVPGNTWFTKLLGPVMIAALLVKALQEVLEFTENFAGKTGEAFSGLVAGAMGMATGGASMMARGVVGGAAAAALRSGKLREGSGAHMAAKAASQASFDVRNLGGKDSIFGEKIGGGLAKGVGSLGLGKGSGVGGVEKTEKDRIKKDLERAKKEEMSIFEEQGVRSRPDEAKAAAEKKLATAETELAVQIKALADAQEKANAETGTPLKEAAKGYEDTRQRAEKDKGTERESESLRAMAKAKDDLDTAKKKHTNAPTTMAVKKVEAALEKAKKEEKEAREVIDKGASGQTKWVIETENKRRRATYANTVRKGGDDSTADKIIKGEESESKKDKLAKLAKEVIAEEEKEKNEGEPKKETGGADKH